MNMAKSKQKAVMVRCYSGVFFGYISDRRQGEVDLTGSRHVWSWDSAGLPRKATTVDDLALLGPGTGSRLSGRVDQTLLEVKQIVVCSDEAVKRFEAHPEGS
jgi:hypothetical protein